MVKDKNGNELSVGDSVRCGGLEYKIESFQNMPTGYLACGDYGCLAVELLEKVEE